MLFLQVLVDTATAGPVIPVWIEVIVAAAALVGALGVLWTKIVRPIIKFTATVDEMLPQVRALTASFRDTPEAYSVLHDIANQFKTDSGSSLRDVVNRLEKATQENHTLNEVLKVGVESSRVLAERDRQVLDRLVILMDRLAIRVDQGNEKAVEDRKHITETLDHKATL